MGNDKIINLLEDFILKISKKIEFSEQHVKHAISWCVSEAMMTKSVLEWGMEEGRSERQQFLSKMSAGQSLERILKGVPMSSLETAWIVDLDSDLYEEFSKNVDINNLIYFWKDMNNRRQLISKNPSEDRYDGLNSDNDSIRDTFTKWCENNVKDYIEDWHYNDSLIPDNLIKELGELGAFGMTLPEEYGGTEIGGEISAVVSDELSRYWIALGSLATRVDIVGEALSKFGTKEQKQKWLPGLISGDLLGAAVFTEPGVGSDLASLKTRASFENNQWNIVGQKTWITHGARTDLMLVLVRTHHKEDRHRGLSLLLVPKTRGNCENPFPDSNISGGEIEVLGYRGMKEYEISFDKFSNQEIEILGGETEKGFKQLMSVFEGARVQTAARAVGVAQSALEEGWSYAENRIISGQKVIDFDRSINKLSSSLCDVVALRALTLWAAREKDSGRRCDLEAGIAKMMGARVATSVADAMLQLHGGNGYALEYPISRIWSDARVLSIFEGASEVQADVIARRLT
jgi:(2S)-methylsuccinyl-CoA dehydrogenase